MKQLLFILLFTPLSIATISGQNTPQKSVFFDTDKAILRPEAQTVLKEWADFMRKMPQFTLRLQGNTDADGSDVYNQNLSERRTDAVRNFLINQGILREKITISALGESKPLADNASEDGKQRNRRVDISFESANAKTIVQNATPFEKGKNYHIMRLYKELSLTPQIFTLKSNKDTLIKGEKGTQLHFPANAFAGVTEGTPIEVKLKECYDYASILAEHLTTKSGDNLLQTGGMIYVQAFANGKELTLQKPMDVQFSSAESKLEGMQLFTGKRAMNKSGAMNWTPVNTEFETREFELPNKVESENDPNAVFVNYYISPKGASNRFLSVIAPMSYILDLTDTDSLFEDFPVFGSISNGSTAEKSHPRSTHFAGNSMGVFACQYKEFMTKDKFTVHRAAFEEVYKFYKVETYQALLKVDSNAWNDHYKMRITKIKEDKRVSDSLYKAGVTAYEKQYKTKVTLTKALKITQLGWINCDRFVNYPEKELIFIGLNDKASSSFDAKLILKKDKVIVSGFYENGQKVDFGKVVRNAPAVIVAMKIENGQSYLAMHDFITSDAAPIDLKFEAVSPEEIKKRLKTLN
jgi:OmpA family